MADPDKHHSTYSAHRRAAQARRSRDTLDLYVQHPGWTYYDLGRAMGISGQRAAALVREALKRAAEDEQNLAGVALARSLKLLQAQMEAAWDIVTKVCGKCSGAGMQQSVDEHGQRKQTFDNSGKVVDILEPCSLCEYASGYAYPYQARLGAIDRHARALDQMNKLLRLYEPEGMTVNFNFRADLANLPLPELNRMLAEYTEGYTAAVPALPPAPQEEEVA